MTMVSPDIARSKSRWTSSCCWCRCWIPLSPRRPKLLLRVRDSLVGVLSHRYMQGCYFGRVHNGFLPKSRMRNIFEGTAYTVVPSKKNASMSLTTSLTCIFSETDIAFRHLVYQVPYMTAQCSPGDICRGVLQVSRRLKTGVTSFPVRFLFGRPVACGIRQVQARELSNNNGNKLESIKAFERNVREIVYGSSQHLFLKKRSSVSRSETQAHDVSYVCEL